MSEMSDQELIESVIVDHLYDSDGKDAYGRLDYENLAIIIHDELTGMVDDIPKMADLEDLIHELAYERGLCH